MEVPEYLKEYRHLINHLAVSRYPFVAYRMPGDTLAYLFIPTAIETLTQLKPYDVREGFIFTPFLPDKPSVLFINPLHPAEFAPKAPADFKESLALKETGREAYIHLINKALSYLNKSKVKKVVLSGVFRQNWGGAHRSALLFENLCRLYPEAYCYVAFIPGYGLWAGASPETLVCWENGQLQTMALAGTLPSTSSIAWSLKEAQEHEWVVTYIEEILKQETGRIPEISGPEEVKAGSARHLCTRLQVDCSQIDALSLAFKLHPTPAVCGVPQAEALQFIRENEPHPRGMYTGFAGLVSNQQLRLFVNLRCARLEATEAFIFAGSGITLDSRAEAEWNEINLKRVTLSTALLQTPFAT